MPSRTVLISGAGIAGPALAYWLVRRGFRVTIVERSPRPRTGGHAVDIRGTALEVVDRMGVGAAVRDHRTAIATLSAVRGTGPKTYDLDVAAMHRAGGDREIEIMRDDLVRILLDAVADDVEILYADAVGGVHPDGDAVDVELAGGGGRTVDLVVGADGHHSATRALVMGPKRRYMHFLGAYLAIFTLDNILDLRDHAVLYNEPGRGAAMFTTRDNARAKALLLFSSDRLDLDLRDTAALYALLRKRFQGAGWETQRFLATMEGAYDFYFDEMSQVKLPAWSHGRVALLGDAAFGPSPLSGQGTSLALIGACLMAHDLAITPNDPESALHSYEERFRDNVSQNQRLATNGMKVLLPGSRAAIAVRNQSLRLAPLISRLGAGFGKEIERASRAIDLPAEPAR